jgi:hypothetical protein
MLVGIEVSTGRRDTFGLTEPAQGGASPLAVESKFVAVRASQSAKWNLVTNPASLAFAISFRKH